MPKQPHMQKMIPINIPVYNRDNNEIPKGKEKYFLSNTGSNSIIPTTKVKSNIA